MHTTDQLVELVRRKHQVLTELCALGRRQLELISRDEMADLLNVLWSKQQLISSLNELQRGLNPFRDQLPEDRSWRSPADRDACARLLAECESLLATILEQERTSEAELTQLRDTTAARLDGAHAAGHARQAYFSSRAEQDSLLDLASEE